MTPKKRTIVFAIGGRFNLDKGITIGHKDDNRFEGLYSDFTLAGQTANDKGGVHLANDTIGTYARHFAVRGQTNMIFRYFDTRFNWQWYFRKECSSKPCKEPSLRFAGVADLIVDHITSSWSSYGLIVIQTSYEVANKLENITIQRSLMHENIMNPMALSDPSYQYNHNGDGGIGDSGRFQYLAYSTANAVNLDIYDTDRDGMPNTWELAHNLDPEAPNNNTIRADRNLNIGHYLVKNNAGYTDLEMYLADIGGDFHMLANRSSQQ